MSFTNEFSLKLSIKTDFASLSTYTVPTHWHNNVGVIYLHTLSSFVLSSLEYNLFRILRSAQVHQKSNFSFVSAVLLATFV